MNPERWRRIEEIFNSVLEREPDRREAFLSQACAGDEDLRREVARLLQNQPEAEDFIESPAIEDAARAVIRERQGGFVDASSKEKTSALAAKSEHSGADDFAGPSRRRAPWWIYAVAAAFLICLSVRYYAWFVAPETTGITTQGIQRTGGPIINFRIVAIAPNSAAARAGLRPGDILSIPKSDGLFSHWGYLESGRTYRLEIKRKEETKIIPLKLERKRAVFITILRPLLDFFLLILAAMIAFKKPYDLSARWGALTMGIIALTPMGASTVLGFYATLSHFPRIVGWLTILIPSICLAISGSVYITFFAIFPRPLFRKRWIWALVWLPALISLPVTILSNHPPIYSFPAWWPRWYQMGVSVLGVLCYLAIGIVVILNYRRCRHPNERRRIRLIVIGFLGFLISIMHIVAILIIGGPVARLFINMSPILLFAIQSLGFALPILMAYAILRHRLFDIHVMIRLGLRYAATRGVLLSLVPAVTVILAGDLLLHRSQPLGDILNHRGTVYAILAGCGFFLHIRREAWLTAVDRRFFREHYDAHRVLRAVLEEIRTARSFGKAGPNVIRQVETALHCEFVALLVRQPGETQLTPLPGRKNPLLPLQSNSKLMELIRVIGKPAEIPQDHSSWPWNHLPGQEREYLQQSRIEWLFPISLRQGQPEVILAVGPKKSEEPYSQEDQDLLQGITNSLALLLEQTPSTTSLNSGFEECPECGTCYDSGSGKCKKEGAQLTPLSFPRMLSNRYCFEQRLGKGGMGIVYRALDTELDRRVAIKLIRPDLIESAEASSRFKQEARAAASLQHPNIVTIYDFGIAEDRRAYLVMELLKGSTLRQQLHQEGRLPIARASGILQGICSAVDAAHKQHLLHRDLKPENIFLANSESREAVKILDFGLVKPMAGTDAVPTISQTGPGMLLGTLSYMSPEALRGEKAAASWDLWALAVVAYEMLTGVLPFAESMPLGVYDAIRAGHIIPLRVHLPEAPASLQFFFDGALAPKVGLRPATALQFFEGFNQGVAQLMR